MSHHLHSPFGSGTFGQLAERFARFFGTPKFIIGQTLIVIIWVILNTNLLHLDVEWDLYPFILLNLAFSTQAAYAAPLILLAQTRQADRDKVKEEAEREHREEMAAMHAKLIEENTQLTQEIKAMAEEIKALTQVVHDHIAQSP